MSSEAAKLEIIAFARKLRQEATDAESCLWSILLNRRVHRRRFRRQHPLEPYVLHFFCSELNLCIELDGGQHADPEEKRKDIVRKAFLRQKGIRTLRFTNHDMLRDTDTVLN